MIPEAFINYLIHFHGDRDYFECHEVLEEYWKEIDPGNKESVFVGFIQLAVSTYHHRRGNFAGAKKTLDKAAKILTNEKKQCEALAIDHAKLIDILTTQRNALLTEKPYKSFNLPITDNALIDKCKKECEQLEIDWGKESNLRDKNLINKHSVRDRSEVIIERERALKKKKQSRDYRN